MKRIFLLTFLLASFIPVAAQFTVEITGPTTALVNETKNYTLVWRKNGIIKPSPPDGIIPNWFVEGGTVFSGNEYGASVQWTSTGTMVLAFSHSTFDNQYYAELTVTVSLRPPPVPNPSFTITQNCNQTIVQRNSNPPQGVKWYWQTSDTGVSLTDSDASIVRATSGDLFLRARYDTSPNQWSVSSQAVGPIAIITTPPAAPATSTNGDIISDTGGPVSLSVSAVSGATAYRWYTVASSGTSIPGANMNNYSPTVVSTTEFYAEAVNGNCPSTSRKAVTAFVHPRPVIQSTNQGVISLARPVMLSASNGYQSYQWLRNGSDISGETAETYKATQTGEYTVRVSKGTATGISLVSSITSGLSGQNMNYIVSNAILRKGVTEADIDTLSVKSLSQNVQYFDGLGRAIQTITTQGSPAKNDIVQPVVYDAYGREARKYLPVVMGANGYIKTIAFDVNGNYTGESGNFYSNNLTGKMAQDTRPFSETTFEASPLSRPVQSYGAGNDWFTSGKLINNQYLINVYGTGSTEERVIAWTIANGLPVRENQKADFIETGGYYSTGSLYVNVTIDEQGNAVREYKNKSGQILLKKVQAVANSTNLNSTNDWALTYYIYDNLGNLRFVLPPELSKLVHQDDSYAPSSTDINNWAFMYRYDTRSRMCVKKVPGADSIFMVYDKRNRLVLTQDGNQRSAATKYWLFTKYDLLNRPILTGIKDTTVALSQAEMQAVVDSHYNKTWAKWGENYIGNAAGNLHGYTNKSYPVVTGPTTTIDKDRYLTVTYYDNYDFRSLWYGPYTYVNENLSEVANGITYTQPSTEFAHVTGKVTGIKTKVLNAGVSGGAGAWNKTINYYDDNNRVVQIVSDNLRGGIDRTTNVYDFVGKILKSKNSHYILWKEMVGVSASGNSITKVTGVAESWSSGATINPGLLPGEDGWLEVTVSETNTLKIIGFADTNPDAGHGSIDYAAYLSNSTLYVYESGTNRGAKGTIGLGDIIRVERTGTTVKYLKNGIVVYTSTVPSNTVLFVDASLFTLGGTLSNVRTSFSPATRVVTRRFEYDHAGRLLKTWHQLDTEPEILLAKNEYNELGQLVDKKLHSTVASGADIKQSVDYCYNIRGWLTKMNESDVNTNEAGDPRDFFGMELYYNQQDAGLANSQLYNGNISAIKWSNNQSLGTVKENAFTYGYDPLNRISTSAFKEKTTSWSIPSNSKFTETGFTYDLNGNIKTLQRNDGRTSGLMDNLVYDYGSTPSNKLVKVTDNGDDFAGFLDGNPGTTTDYTYDANGNMITDGNKLITTPITYNFLNLPEVVSRGGLNSVRYIYDATGRKLSQVAFYNNQPQKTTDYVGEFQYENDVLQFVTHEEGRIVLTKPKTIFINNGDVTTNMTAVTSTIAAITANNQTYVRATAVGSTSRQGIFPIGSTISVQAGDRYVIRAKGYVNSGYAVHLNIKVNGADVNWPGAAMGFGSASESWTEQFVTIQTAGTLEAGVIWNTVFGGAQFFLNEFEIIKLEANTPEYQYNLKDHLGNVRVTFTTKDETLTETATLETVNTATEKSQFVRYAEARRVQSYLFDRTNGSAPSTTTGYAQRLSAIPNERYGLGKSISVMPGDVINAEVYAKYVDYSSIDQNSPAGQALINLLNQISATAAGVVVDGTAYNNSTSTFPFPTAAAQNTASSSESGPKAYLNWLVFDRNFNFILSESGYDRLSTLPKEVGQDVDHERLYSPTITVKQAGYVYIYVSNEESSPLEVYFDEFKVTHTKSPVIQTDDYYPFGLTFNSYSRENSTTNNYLYNGKDKQDELDLGWYDYGARMYMPEIGRWGVIDPKTELVYHWTPYRYGYNNPIRFFDRDGMTEEERQKAVEWIQAYMKAHAKDKYTLYTNDCASTVAGAIMSVGNFGDLREGPGIRGFGNGVARIASMAREIKKNEARIGDILTFKTKRTTHQGVDGEFDHIGMITKVNVDEKGNVIGYRVIQTGNSGTYEVDIDLNKDKDWIQLKGAWQWDTEEEKVYQGPELEPVVITGERIERKERLPEGLDENYRKPGRAADQNYSPEFLKWWYSSTEKK